MIVGTTGRWKYPIGYFCVKSLDAEKQKNLVLEAIINLHSIGINVCQIYLQL